MRPRLVTVAVGGAGLLVAAASSPVVTNFAAAPIGISPTASVVLGDRGAALMASHRSSSTTTTPHTASGTEYDPQATQTFLLGEAPNNWNPHAAVNADPEIASPLATILGPVLPSVFTVKPGYGVALNTTFMSSARQVGNDPQTIRYRINPEATWSDGTPITYQDFVYAWQSQARGSGASSASAITSGYRQIASVSEVGGDPYVVSVVFSTPDYDWRSLFSFLLPAHVAETVGFTDPTAVVSGGPFEVQSSVPGVSVTLVRNPRWWGSPPHLAQVRYLFVPDPTRVLAAFQQGQVGAGSVRPTAGLAAGLAKVSGLDTNEVAGPVWEHLDFNQANPLLAAPPLRQAIMLAIDRTQLITATVGRADPAIKPLNSLLFVADQPGYRNDAGRHATADVAEAKATLLAAGYMYQGGRLLTGPGQPVTLAITTDAGDALHQAVARFVVSALAGIGITVTETDSSDLATTLQSGAFDLAVVTSVASPYLSEGAARYVPGGAGAPGPANQDHIADPTLEALATKAAATRLGVARTQAYRRLDRALLADAVSLPLFQEPLLQAWDRSYLNMSLNAAPGGLTWNMAQWGVSSGG